MAIIERLEEFFQGPTNPERELSLGFTKLRIPSFDVDIVREALLNAITHRDYLSPNEVLVRHEPTELIVTNPGGFLGGITPQNILRQQPFARNRRLAEAFQTLGLVERAGMGRDRIFVPTLRYGKRIPIYDASSERVTLRIFDGSVDERLAKLVALWSSEGRDLWLDSLLLLSYLKTHHHIETPDAAELLQLDHRHALDVLEQHAMPPLSILERIGRSNPASYHLTKGIARALVGRAIYTRAKGRDDIRQRETVRNYVQDHDSINNSELRELLGLGNTKSAEVDASRILARYSSEKGFLEKFGPQNRPRYRLRGSESPA